MRKITLFILALVLAPALLANEINLEQAKTAAEIFFSHDPSLTRAKTCKLTLVNDEEFSTTTKSGPKAAFYIFNREGGGFVIISAIEEARQVLGYSFENSFCQMDDMPENLSDWLDEYRWQINEWRSSGKGTTAEKTAATDSYGGGKDLGTPDWGQGEPFNRKCPLDNAGERTLVGCVSTAICELMHLYKHPDAGSGTLPSYTKNKITVPEIILGENYNWSDMLPKYSEVSYTEEQADAVSTLCYHIAAMSQSSFSAEATSAAPEKAIPRLITYFGYDNGCTMYDSQLFSYDDWRKLLIGSIDNGAPVIYTGYPTSGSGHCFIIDGYDSSGRMLINFGWNASSNGYYEIGAFGKYTRSNECWINVKPEAGGQDTGYMSLKANTYGNYCGLKYIDGAPESGSSFHIKFGHVTWNSKGCTFTGEINFRILDKDGKEKGWAKDSSLEISDEMASGSSRYWTDPIKLSIPTTVTVEKGDYIESYYRESGSSEWKAIKYQDSEISVIGRIYCHIADFTSMKFDASSRELVFTTFSDASYTLRTSSGSDVSEGVSFSGGILTIDTMKLASGKYTATFTCGGQSTSVSFKI